MTPLRDRIAGDLREAVRARDEPRKSALRLLSAAIRNAEIEARGELDEGGILAVVQRQAKQRRESIDEFRRGGRDDLVEREELELRALAGYLPEPAAREELVEAAREAIAAAGASGPRDLGKVMPALVERFRGRADGREISAVVRELLG